MVELHCPYSWLLNSKVTNRMRKNRKRVFYIKIGNGMLVDNEEETPQKSYIKFQNSTTSFSWIYLKFAHFPVKIGLIGGRGVPEIYFWLESSSLCYLGAHAKICNPMLSLSGIYLKLAPFPVKIGLLSRVVLFFIGIPIFVWLGIPHNFSKPYDKSFWDIFEISPFSGQNRVNWGWHRILIFCMGS